MVALILFLMFAFAMGITSRFGTRRWPLLAASFLLAVGFTRLGLL